MTVKLFPFLNFSLVFYYYKGTFSSLFKGSTLIKSIEKFAMWKKMTLVASTQSTIHDIKSKTIAPLNKQMKRERVEKTSELIERDSLSHESWKGKFNFKYLYNLFHNYDKDNWLYVIMPFFKQTSQNKVYLKKIIVGTSNVDRSPPTFTYPVQKDTLFKTLNIRKSKFVCPVETQGFENHILFRDPWGQIREYPPPPPPPPWSNDDYRIAN